MIAYRLEEREGERVTYRYSVEGRREDSGRAAVILSADGGSVERVEVLEPAPSDEAMGYPWHGSKVRHVAERAIETGEWREEGRFLWY